MVYTTRTNSLLTRCKQRAVRYSPRCTNRDPHFRFSLRESQRPPPHGRTPIAPWANAHRPMGERPPPRGRWLFALQERKWRQNDSFPCFLFAGSGCFSMRTHSNSHLTSKVSYFHDFWFYVAWIVPKIVPNPLTFANSTQREYTLCLYKCKKNLSLYPTIQLFFRNLP